MQFSVKSKIVAVIVVFFTLVSVALFLQPNEADARSKTKSAKAEGWWLLCDYHDRIMETNSIGKFSLAPPVFDAILVNVTNDSVFTSGTVQPDYRTSRSEGDTLCKTGTMKFVFRKRSNELTVEFTDKNKVRTVYHYRRMLSHEYLALTKDVFVKGKFWPLKQNYRSWFVAHLISGSYRNVKDGSTLNLNNNESMSGFAKWNAFEVDDYFGSGHRTSELDMIRFQDSTRTGALKDYNWRWLKDTLILTSIVGKDGSVLGTEQHKFVRQNTPAK